MCLLILKLDWLVVVKTSPALETPSELIEPNGEHPPMSCAEKVIGAGNAASFVIATADQSVLFIEEQSLLDMKMSWVVTRSETNPLH